MVKTQSLDALLRGGAAEADEEEDDAEDGDEDWVRPCYAITSSGGFAIGCEGSGKLYRARSRLYRSQILQENMRLKALAEIYTMHSFAQL